MKGGEMADRNWRICLSCQKAIFDLEEKSCFRCGDSHFKEITRPQLLEMKEGTPTSGIIIQTRYWGDII